jgi:SET domain-containing protein
VWVRVMVFNATSNNISVEVSFIGGRNRIIRRKPPTCHKTDELYPIMLFNSLLKIIFTPFLGELFCGGKN